MAATLTLGIVKPDAVETGKTGAILAHLQQAGFTVRAARLVRLTRAEADSMLAGLKERITDLVDGRFPQPFRDHRGFRGGPHAPFGPP